MNVPGVRERSVWSTEDRLRWFLLSSDEVTSRGGLRIRNLEGRTAAVDEDSIAAFEVTEEQARRSAKDQLGRTLDELKVGLDERLAQLRAQLDQFDRTPVKEDTTITPNAAAALFDFVKALPRVIGRSISGDDTRVAAARDAMAELQQRLKEAGIEVDDRVKGFPDRLASLRAKPEEPPD
jgi:hypothetical protein